MKECAAGRREPVRYHKHRENNAMSSGKILGILAMVTATIAAGTIAAAGDEQPVPPVVKTEFSLLLEFTMNRQYNACTPDHILASLVTESLPLATEAKARLASTTLHADTAMQELVRMAVEIAGQPTTEKEMFVMQSVVNPVAFGADYGAFVAERAGEEGETADKTVTAFARSALDGTLRYLNSLPGGEGADDK